MDNVLKLTGKSIFNLNEMETFQMELGWDKPYI